MKKIFAFILSFIMTMVFSLNVFAAEETKVSNDFTARASLINNVTGEKTPIEVGCIMPIYRSASNDSEQTITVQAVVKLPVNEGIMPLFTDTSQVETDAAATISINYDRAGDKIRVNRVYGSWSSSNNQIYFNNREVHYGDGDLYYGHSEHKYPSNNSFSYTTGWPYVTHYPANTTLGTGARAFSSATVGISGMTPHTIEVVVYATS